MATLIREQVWLKSVIYAAVAYYPDYLCNLFRH